MNRRNFFAFGFGGALALALPKFSEHNLGWLRYAENVWLKVPEEKLAEVLKVARKNQNGYGVEVLNNGWCNVYIG